MVETFQVMAFSLDGSVSFRTETNEKGYKKSIENSQLWHIHKETNRLVPYDTKAELQKLHRIENTVIALYAAHSSEAQNLPRTGDISVLHSLEAIIHQRKKELPEGSYTTHLFQSGEEKIRKKLGEEAVEVLLAKTNEEITYESADLLYHMLVLFSEKGISVSNLLEELAKRM